MATIVMESAKVIEAANNVIKNINAKRERLDHKTISHAMQQNMFSFKRWFYKMNREEAINWINNQGWTSSWGFSIYAYGDLSHANKLLKLAQHGDPVTLNEEDIRVLF